MDKNKFYINFIYFLSMLSLIAVRIIFALGVFDNLENYNRIFSLLVQIVAMGVVPFTLYWIYLKTTKQSTPTKRLFCDFGYDVFPNKKAWLIALIISLLSSFIVVCVSSVWHGLLSVIGYNKGLSTGRAFTSWEMLLLEMVFTATLPTIFEEFTNRGLLYYGHRQSAYKVIFITALMFALMHTNITQVGYTFVAGLISGAMVYYTKSIYPAMLAHFVNNGISVLRSFGTGTGNFCDIGNRFYNWIFGSVAGYVVGNVLFITAVLAVIVLLPILGMEKQKGKTLFSVERIDDVKVIKTKSLGLENLFLYVTIVMMSAVTIFTLVWGLIR